MVLYFQLVLLLLLSTSQQVFGIFGQNFFYAYDINLRPPIWYGSPIQLTGWTEIGFQAHAYNADGIKTNVLGIWSENQDALAMLRGYSPDNPITQFYVKTLDMPDINGIRGTLTFKGSLKGQQGGINFRYHAPHNLTVGIYLPIMHMALKHVEWQDNTKNIGMDDVLVINELTSKLRERVHDFDPTLNLNGWDRTGVGDLFLFTEWQRQFYQGREILKNVGLCGRVGFAFPTGLKTNEDYILSIPFGFDGSFGIIFGGGIDLTWFDIFMGGIDVEFIEIFGNTRMRRIKTNPDQTEFLLLTKVPAYKDFGFTQRFNLYLDSKLWRGFSIRSTYQFWKHSPDSLTLKTNEFSDNTANTAQSLEQWTVHQMIVQLAYDGQCDIPNSSIVKPQFSMFLKFPFNGERAILFDTFGFTLSFNF